MSKLNTQSPPCAQTAVKCRFFAQYFQQIVAKETKHLKSPTINTTTVFLINQIENYHLELKPLSKATREDAYEVYCKMWEVDENLIESDTKMAIIWFKNYGTLNYAKFNQQQTDFLRSKGYALPFMEYSVQDLVSLGWLRLLSCPSLH